LVRADIAFNPKINFLVNAIFLLHKYQLYLASGIPQSTLASIKKKRSGAVKISTLYSICEGFNISLEEFFSSPLFSRTNLTD